MPELQTMNDLFVDEIRDLYDAEKQLVKALPKMAKAAHSEELKRAFETHLAETENQVNRLEQIFNSIGEKTGGETCDAMKGLVKEGEKMIDNTDEGEVRDAGLIAAAQRVEHYEMAGYGAAREFAEELGLGDAESLLQQTLEEEKAADSKLNAIAKSTVNRKAAPLNDAGTIRSKPTAA
jgi:ferritin-like metal-binding protein YciE